MATSLAETFSVLSWNVRGLNSKFKRALLMRYLKTHSPHFILLQETHLTGSKVLTLKKPWIQRAIHATYSSYARGVSILIHKKFPCVIEDVCTDPQGKFAMVVFSHWSQRYIIINVYIPPPFTHDLLYKVLEKAAPFYPAKLLVMGDFNSTISPDLDRPVPSKNYSSELSIWAQAMGLQEIWRWKHPAIRAYSCFSASHRTASRIDLAFSNSILLTDVIGAKYLPSGLSDHSPLVIELRSPARRDAALWRLGAQWISHPEVADTIPPRLVEFWELNEGSSTPQTVWDTFKAYTRGQYISIIASVKKQQGRETYRLQQMVEDQTLIYSTDPTAAHFDALNAARSSLNLHLTEVTRLDMHKGRQRLFEQGDKNGRFLAMLAQHEYPSTVVSGLRSSTGDKVTSQVEILQMFKAFYQTLYTSALPPDFQPEMLQNLLDPLALGWLSNEERESLVRPISALEVLKIIRSFPLGKAPGPDGLPIEFYRAHAAFLAPILAQLYTLCLSKGDLPLSMHQAYLTLIHKDLKDPELCASYRPIALLNNDLKILTKLLATRLYPLLPSVIDSDQTGFMPKRTTDVNLRRLFTNIHAQHNNSGTRAIALLDIEKAFDTVEWPFLWETLRRMGFPLRFISWLQVIYRCPISSIRLGSRLSTPFQLFRGTRQGCPLSPALFALAIEPVAEALRTSPHIKGLRIGMLEERVALYADDMVLFLGDAGPSLQGALSLLNTFSMVTGLRVNWPKSTLFPIDQAAKLTSSPDSPLKWVDSFKYLGVCVSAQASDFLKLNLDPVVGDMKAKLKAWNNLPLSVWGRVNLLKMKVIPKFIYLFRHSPQWIPKSFFTKLNQRFSEFLWGSLPPRYKLTTLMRPLSQGGMAFPDCYKYFLATQLVTVVWWLNPDKTNVASALEATVAGSWESLQYLIYRGPCAPHLLTPSMLTTLRAWKMGLAIEKHSQMGISPNTPLWLNPNLPHFYKSIDPQIWTRYGIKLISQVVSCTSLLSFCQLSSQYNLPQHYQFRYLQLSHAFEAQFPRSSCILIQSKLETTLRSGCTKKPISHIYQHLIYESLPPLDGLLSRWQRDIPALSGEDWDGVWDFPFSSLVSIRDKLVQFKIVHRAYFTPHRLHLINPAHSPKCWRCSYTPGDFSHIFWHCPKIQQFWGEVLGLINKIASTNLPLSMEICMLGLIKKLVPAVAKRTMIGLLLFYARKTITFQWKKPYPPTNVQWKRLVNDNLPLYKDTYLNRGCQLKFNKVWSGWLEEMNIAY